jgi:hypothetical protein
MDPVVLETPVITGPGVEVELTDTLSKVAVVSEVVLLLVTASPTYAFAAMLIVTGEPICVQYTPSADRYPVNVFPLRTTFTQYGNPMLVAPDWLVPPPVVARSLKIATLYGVP